MALTLQDLEQEIARLRNENKALAQKAQAPRAQQTIVKLNSVNGLFIRDPSFRAWSENKEKHYTACVNVPPAVAIPLFTPNPDGSPNALLRHVMDFVAKTYGANEKKAAA